MEVFIQNYGPHVDETEARLKLIAEVGGFVSGGVSFRGLIDLLIECFFFCARWPLWRITTHSGSRTSP